MSTTALFLDTNSLLHYRAVKDIDWCSLCNSKSVVLILCMPVIDELDEKKSHPMLSERAKRSIKEVSDFLDSGLSVRSGVTLEIYSANPRTEDMPTTLNPGSVDDIIVHLALRYKKDNAGDTVAICSEDMGMKLRSASHGIELIEPDKNQRLDSPASDLAKKNQRLTAKILEYENRLPDLKFTIEPQDAVATGNGPVEFILGRISEKNSQWVGECLRNYQEANQLHPISASHSAVWTLEHDKTIAIYNEELKRHIQVYRSWVEKTIEEDKIHERTVKCSIWIDNTGKQPAENIRLTIIFPDSISYVCDPTSPIPINTIEDFEDELLFPSQPKPPALPKPKMLSSVIVVPGSFGGRPSQTFLINETRQLSFDARTNRFEAAFSHEQLRHGEAVKLSELYLVLREGTLRPFEIEYKILENTHPTPPHGKITILVRPDPALVMKSIWDDD